MRNSLFFWLGLVSSLLVISDQFLAEAVSFPSTEESSKIKGCWWENSHYECHNVGYNAEDLTVGIIITIVIGALVFLIGFVILICFFCACCCFEGRGKSTGQVHTRQACEYRHALPAGHTQRGVFPQQVAPGVLAYAASSAYSQYSQFPPHHMSNQAYYGNQGYYANEDYYGNAGANPVPTETTDYMKPYPTTAN